MFNVGDVIARHRAVEHKHGAVWFGKLGSTISQIHLDKMNNQIEEKKPTYLFLIKGNRRKQTYYKADLLEIHKNKIESYQNEIPEYYSEIGILDKIKIWARIKNIVKLDSTELRNLKVASSVMPLDETVGKSSSGHFILRYKND